MREFYHGNPNSEIRDENWNQRHHKYLVNLGITGGCVPTEKENRVND